MSLANWKAELKFNWTNHYVLSANTNSNKIILIIKDTKVFFSLATLSANDHQNLSKPFNKGLRRSVYRNKYNTKSENKERHNNEFKYFLESGRLFVLVYSNQDYDAKMYEAKRNYLPKSVIKNYNIITKGKNFYNKPIHFDMKGYKEIKKLTRGQSEYCTTR